MYEIKVLFKRAGNRNSGDCPGVRIGNKKYFFKYFENFDIIGETNENLNSLKSFLKEYILNHHPYNHSIGFVCSPFTLTSK